MNKTLEQQIRLGVFVLTGIAILILGVYLVGKKDHVLGNTSRIYAVFNHINGLRIGNNVRFGGINIGSVKAINMESDTSIVVTLNVQKNIIKHIKSNARAIIITDGLVGNMIINILPGIQDGKFIQEGDTIRSLKRVQTDEMLNTLSVTNENAALLTAELLDVIKSFTSGNGMANALIKDSVMVNDLKEIIQNVRITTQEAASSAKILQLALKNLDNKNNVIGTAKDTILAKQIKDIVIKMGETSNALQKTVDNLNQTVVNANTTVLNIKDGDGMINYLSNNKDAVQSTRQTIKNLDTTVVQLKEASIKMNETFIALRRHWLLRKYFEENKKGK